MHGTDVGAETRGVGVVGDRNGDFDIVGGAAAFELCFCLRMTRLVASEERRGMTMMTMILLTCIRYDSRNGFPRYIPPKSEV